MPANFFALIAPTTAPDAPKITTPDLRTADSQSPSRTRRDQAAAGRNDRKKSFHEYLEATPRKSQKVSTVETSEKRRAVRSKSVDSGGEVTPVIRKPRIERVDSHLVYPEGLIPDQIIVTPTELTRADGSPLNDNSGPADLLLPFDLSSAAGTLPSDRGTVRSASTDPAGLSLDGPSLRPFDHVLPYGWITTPHALVNETGPSPLTRIEGVIGTGQSENAPETASLFVDIASEGDEAGSIDSRAVRGPFSGDPDVNHAALNGLTRSPSHGDLHGKGNPAAHDVLTTPGAVNPSVAVTATVRARDISNAAETETTDLTQSLEIDPLASSEVSTGSDSGSEVQSVSRAPGKPVVLAEEGFDLADLQDQAVEATTTSEQDSPSTESSSDLDAAETRTDAAAGTQGMLRTAYGHAAAHAAPSVIGRIANQVAAAIVTDAVMTEVGDTITLDAILDPPDLGRLHIRLSRSETGLTATVTAEDGDVQQLIAEHSATIESVVRTQLKTTDSTQFVLADQSSGNSASEQGGHQQSQHPDWLANLLRIVERPDSTQRPARSTAEVDILA